MKRNSNDLIGEMGERRSLQKVERSKTTVCVCVCVCFKNRKCEINGHRLCFKVLLRVWETSKSWKEGEFEFLNYVNEVYQNSYMDKLGKPKTNNKKRKEENKIDQLTEIR